MRGGEDVKESDRPNEARRDPAAEEPVDHADDPDPEDGSDLGDGAPTARSRGTGHRLPTNRPSARKMPRNTRRVCISDSCTLSRTMRKFEKFCAG